MAKPESPVIPGYEPLPGDNCRAVSFKSPDPEVRDLPALMFKDRQRTVLTRWELTPQERYELYMSGSLYLWLNTFGAPIPPVAMTFEPPSVWQDTGFPDGPGKHEPMMHDEREKLYNAEGNALLDIVQERQRQSDKWGVQDKGPGFYLAVLIEETGEVGRSLIGTDGTGNGYDPNRTYEELIQVAATAMQWAARLRYIMGNEAAEGLVRAGYDPERLPASIAGTEPGDPENLCTDPWPRPWSWESRNAVKDLEASLANMGWLSGAGDKSTLPPVMMPVIITMPTAAWRRAAGMLEIMSDPKAEAVRKLIKDNGLDANDPYELSHALTLEEAALVRNALIDGKWNGEAGNTLQIDALRSYGFAVADLAPIASAEEQAAALLASHEIPTVTLKMPGHLWRTVFSDLQSRAAHAGWVEKLRPVAEQTKGLKYGFREVTLEEADVIREVVDRLGFAHTTAAPERERILRGYGFPAHTVEVMQKLRPAPTAADKAEAGGFAGVQTGQCTCGNRDGAKEQGVCTCGDPDCLKGQGAANLSD